MTMPTSPVRRLPRHPAALQMLLRRWHAYIGMIIAPTVLLFATTGVLQIYELHEAHPGYAPPAIVAKLGVLHKKQLYREGRRPPSKPSTKPATGLAPAASPPVAKAQRLPTTLLKAFFALASVGLVISTITGVWMTLRQPLRRMRHVLLLVAGTVVPLVLSCLSR
ncbi:PepSY domain-containing protein [Caulobacter sp. FWC2]|uniref:PepSY domain-containing protein n=1 Tax=Caulobacter sp. FWC2 TaxID=69664 RepID=UPI00117831BF|nr:PepSY domain-containing protein [Caulobacter sp. FWC2]